MVMQAVRLALGVTLALVIAGSNGSVCHTTVDSLDLGCLLRWDCPRAGVNATYTVQTKTQGDPWKDVPWCVRVSSDSCDISMAFADFGLYYMVRVGVHLGAGPAVWREPRKFDYSDFTFSPPSVVVSLNGDRLSVRVQFPCAASRRCSLKSCCPVSELIDPWLTVTVYNQLHHSAHQSRTVWTQEVVNSVEFTGLAPGQSYCAVANFSFPSFSIAASPKSLPQCVKTPPESMLVSVLVVVALCSAFVASVLILFLLKQRPVALATENQPKAPAAPADPVSLLLVPQSPAPVELCDINVQLVDDHVSVASSDSTKDWERDSAPNLHGDAKSAVGNLDSRVRDLGLDSGINLSPASHS